LRMDIVELAVVQKKGVGRFLPRISLCYMHQLAAPISEFEDYPSIA
jgi:hypothetical protein